MTATYQRERVADLWLGPDLVPLLDAHYREIAHWHDITLKPDTQLYDKIDELGQFRAYTARVGGRLVAYAAFFVRHNLHYRESLQAQQDVVFVHPDFRAKLIGWHLLRFAEAALAREGVQVCWHHVKLAHPMLGKLLRRLGYEPIEMLYAKRLDELGRAS